MPHVNPDGKHVNDRESIFWDRDGFQVFLVEDLVEPPGFAALGGVGAQGAGAGPELPPRHGLGGGGVRSPALEVGRTAAASRLINSSAYRDPP